MSISGENLNKFTDLLVGVSYSLLPLKNVRTCGNVLFLPQLSAATFKKVRSLGKSGENYTSAFNFKTRVFDFKHDLLIDLKANFSFMLFEKTNVLV